MADSSNTTQEIAALKREDAELEGLVLATGVILTQLLQRICARELNPQAAAGRIMESARGAIEGFTSQTNADQITKDRALEAVRQFEEQIKSVLQV